MTEISRVPVTLEQILADGGAPRLARDGEIVAAAKAVRDCQTDLRRLSPELRAEVACIVDRGGEFAERVINNIDQLVKGIGRNPDKQHPYKVEGVTALVDPVAGNRVRVKNIELGIVYPEIPSDFVGQIGSQRIKGTYGI